MYLSTLLDAGSLEKMDEEMFNPNLHGNPGDDSGAPYAGRGDKL
jgi:hypothetical protein